MFLLYLAFLFSAKAAVALLLVAPRQHRNSLGMHLTSHLPERIHKSRQGPAQHRLNGLHLSSGIWVQLSSLHQLLPRRPSNRRRPIQLIHHFDSVHPHLSTLPTQILHSLSRALRLRRLLCLCCLGHIFIIRI